jgi:hypothetical protein
MAKAKVVVKKKVVVNRMKLISTRAKEIRSKKPSMKWTAAISKASAELKKEGAL